MSAINQVLFDIGGVLGSNGWDREQRAVAVEKFALDSEDFQYRHEETVGAFESGQISLDEYLDVTVFWQPRAFSRDDFKRFMFSLSTPWADSLDVVRRLRERTRGRPTRVRMATLNNESRELNEYRIRYFGLCELFDVFFSSCWLGVRKPTRQIYERVLGMTQADPASSVFVDDREQNLAPARAPVDDTIQALVPSLTKGDIIIDGGNSNFHDTIRRAASLAKQGIEFVDSGTSGGIWGLENGYCLMVGGSDHAVKQCEPIFRALAPEDGYAHVGPSGAGHYVKMVHNGIEYA